MVDKIVTVDVRGDIRNGGEPFSRIMGAVAGLAEGQDLLLIAPFEPLPLFGVLAKKGFQHASREVTKGHWEVMFSRAANSESPIQNDTDVNLSANRVADSIVDMDARGLKPPQPVTRILEMLDALPYGARLRAHTDSRPTHLDLHLEARGFIGESHEQNDGSFITYIRRKRQFPQRSL